MAPVEIVLLLSLGSFQAFVPGVTKAPSPVFEDNEQGLKAFTAWTRTTIGEPKFNQPPHRLCVVGAVPFKDKAPYVTEPIWKSKMPVRHLEPYSATFHYLEPDASGKPQPPRSLKQALEICKVAAKP